ncbi:hypothetical protein RUND412_002893 [Rhizina undulata]
MSTLSISPLVLTASPLKITPPPSNTTATFPDTPTSSYPGSPATTAYTSAPTSPVLKAKRLPNAEEPRHLQDPLTHSHCVGLRLIVPGRKATLGGTFEDGYRVIVWYPPTAEEVQERRERDRREKMQMKMEEKAVVVDWSGVKGLWSKEERKSEQEAEVVYQRVLWEKAEKSVWTVLRLLDVEEILKGRC